MKNLILGLFIVASFSVDAQTNNPYNGFGSEYFKSVAIVVEDIKANGFKGVDQKSLDYYVGLATVKAGINPEVAKQVYEAANTKGLRADKVIMGSKYSDEWKQLSLKILTDLSSYGEDERGRFFSSLVEDISGGKMNEMEKELLLKLVAISNQAYENYSNTGSVSGDAGMEGRIDCGIDGPDGTILNHPATCVGAAAVVGAVIGGSLCGPPCAIGGAIVFAVITTIAVC